MVAVTQTFVPGPRLIDGSDLMRMEQQINNGLTAAGANITNTAISTVGAGTLTAAGIIGGLITRSGSTAPFTDTTDTAANIIAAVPAYPAGQTWELLIVNSTAFQQTISGGTGVTITGNTIVGGLTTGRFLVTISSATAVAILGLGVQASTNTITNMIQNGSLIASAQSYTSNTSLANITGLSANVVAGQTYIVQGGLQGSANTAAGIKVAFSGTAAMTSSDVNVFAYSTTSLVANTNQTTWGSNILAMTATFTNAQLQGTFVVQTSGTVTLAASQNVTQTTATTLTAGTYLEIARVT